MSGCTNMRSQPETWRTRILTSIQRYSRLHGTSALLKLSHLLAVVVAVGPTTWLGDQRFAVKPSTFLVFRR